MDHLIRKATLHDAGPLARLVNSAYRGDSSRKGWTTEADLLEGTRTDEAGIRELITRANHAILICERSGELLGCVEIDTSNPHKLYLGMLTVNPDLQGKGIGKILMKAAEEEGAKSGCHSVYMTVISVRKELIEWYKRQGYQETGERKPFSFNDPRFGLPKKSLEFIVLEKKLI